LTIPVVAGVSAIDVGVVGEGYYNRTSILAINMNFSMAQTIISL
jgi:hypothetical protein